MNIYESLMRLLFPPKCIVCEKDLDFSSDTPYCNKCLFLLNEGRIYSLMDEQLKHIDAVYAFYEYENESVKHSVFHLKKLFSKPFAEFFESICLELFEAKAVLVGIDAVTFVKRRNSEKRREGFDQAYKMAKIISDATGIPCVKALKRVKRSKKQRSLSLIEREKNVKGVFKCKIDLTGKRILLVDDVVTTGSTISECAKALKKRGASEVRVLTFSI